MREDVRVQLEGARAVGLAGRLRRPEVAQFVKFCIVGASSTLIHLLVLTVTLREWGFGLEVSIPAALASRPEWLAWLDPVRLAVATASSIGFIVAVTNGFFWNRRWTFAHSRSRPVRKQYAQFALVDLVGLGLNATIVYLIVGVIRSLIGPAFAPQAAQLVATGVVVFWNFFANKHWTFK